MLFTYLRLESVVWCCTFLFILTCVDLTIACFMSFTFWFFLLVRAHVFVCYGFYNS
jgi:hypothetical protein